LQAQIQNDGDPVAQAADLIDRLGAAEAIKVPAGSKGAVIAAEKQKQIADLEALIQKTAYGKITRANLEGQLAAVKKQDAAEITSDHSQIAALHAQNLKIGGSTGTAGQIGGVRQNITGLGTQVTNLKTTLAEITGSGDYSPLSIQGVGGIGGLLGPAELQLATLQAEDAQLQPPALAAALAAAQAQYAAGTSSSTDPNDALAGLLEQQNDQLAEQLQVSQRQYAVLANLPPYGGSFATGGMVPGALGEARTIIAHGGEVITPVGGGAATAATPHVHVNFTGETAWLKKFVNVEIHNASRVQGRQVNKALPGRGGGVLAAR
jgi:hypothetical protein